MKDFSRSLAQAIARQLANGTTTLVALRNLEELRLAVGLLGSAFINLAWLGLVGPNLEWALGLSLIYAFAVFRWV